MRRIYEARAYDTPSSCWWQDTSRPADLPELAGDLHTEVAVIGGGFTGLNTALALAKAGVAVTVIDAEQPGWGASGRNGGFCCLGGAKASGAILAKRYGADQRAQWHKAEQAAVDHVSALLATYDISADTHSDGETLLAHSPKAMQDIKVEAEEARRIYGVEPDVFDAHTLRQLGLNGSFHGGMTLPIGFALNPGKYHAGLLRAATDQGVSAYGQTPATAITKTHKGWRITTSKGCLHAPKVIIATNGYSSEDVPDWLRSRYMPVQSSIIVTRPITQEEQAHQGWTSGQMCYDTRILLHYFRLMPDGRFLFGMRGGRRATDQAQHSISQKIRMNFHRMFPSWRDIEITHEWSGLLCLMRSFTPFTGPVPEMPGVFASMGYHGNGVAMGSYLGARLADTVLGRPSQGPFPAFLTRVPERFPLGPFRRALLAPAYAGAALFDG